jgi:glycosyltransferase involved in cell wall biosynthesis
MQSWMNRPWLNEGVRIETNGLSMYLQSSSGEAAEIEDSASKTVRESPGRRSTIASPRSDPPATALLQTTIPEYRASIVTALRARLGGQLLVLAGENDFEPTVRLTVADLGVVVVPNVYLIGRRLVWQRRCIRRLLQPDVVVLELNPRVLSSWVVLAVRHIRRKPTVLWGHAWPRSGAASQTDRIRHAMRRLASGILVYTDTQADELSHRMPKATIRSAPNALYSQRLAVAATDTRTARDVLFVGRLVARKKPALLLEAFLAALPSLPDDTSLVFVGDGDLREQLEQRVDIAGAEDRVRFEGSVTDFQALRNLYWDALVSVSPGYVGLSLIQSLWFGVPMIIARDEPHSPEIEAAQDGTNSILVASDSITDLRDAIAGAFADRAAWAARGPSIARACSARYSVESMVGSMVEVIEAQRR